MTFSADAITACEVNAAGETPDIGDKAAQELAGLIVSEQNVDAGMDFMICEQNTTVGDSRHWIGAVDSKAMQAAGVKVQKDRLLNEIARYASYKCNMDVIKMWMDHSAEMLDYMESLGYVSSVHIAPESHVGGNNMEYYVPSIWHSINPGEGMDEETAELAAN